MCFCAWQGVLQFSYAILHNGGCAHEMSLLLFVQFLYFFPHGFLQIILIGLDIYDTSQYMFLFENPILFAKYKPKAYCFFLIKTYKSSVVRTLRTKPNVYTTRFTV